MVYGSRWLQKIFWRSDESGFERRVGVLRLFVLAKVEIAYCLGAYGLPLTV